MCCTCSHFPGYQTESQPRVWSWQGFWFAGYLWPSCLPAHWYAEAFPYSSSSIPVSQCMRETAAQCLSLGCSKSREVVPLVRAPQSLPRIICLISRRQLNPSSFTWPNTAWCLWRAYAEVYPLGTLISTVCWYKFLGFRDFS